eukprot:COSAG01_NODE_35848_length_525_cov_13.293269_1_plen_73_part_10
MRSIVLLISGQWLPPDVESNSVFGRLRILSSIEIWPYAYFYYNSGRQNFTLTKQDALVSVTYPYELGAAGLVI